MKSGRNKVIIISGGKIEDAFVNEWIKDTKPDYIIAVDSGMEFMKRAELLPDMITGDFDSVSEETLSWFRNSSEKILCEKLNPIKDDTDTEFAIRKAISLGASEIELLGATGTRLDHVLGNIELLGIGLNAGVPITIIDKNNRIRLIDSGITIDRETQFGTYVSLIPYSREVTHLYLEGFKYPLTDYCLRGFSSLGVSNEIVEEQGTIRFEEGLLIAIESLD